MPDGRDWLRSERGGDDDLAEAKFARLLAEMPAIEPGADFVGRTVQNVWRARNRRRVFGSLVHAGVALFLVGTVLGSLYELRTLLSGLLVRGTVTFCHALTWLLMSAAEGARWWWIANRIGTAVGDAIASPSAVASVAAVEITILLAIYVLRQLLERESVRHESRKVGV